MAKKPPTVSELIRQAILESGLSLYQIEQDTGVNRSTMMRFLRHETSLRLDKADLLVQYLGIEWRLVSGRKDKTKGA